MDAAAEVSYKSRAHQRAPIEGVLNMPWLVDATASGALAKDYEPNIYAHGANIEDQRLAYKIGQEALTPEEIARIPKRLVVGRNSSGDVPAILGWNLGPFIVNQRVKEILEELEPGIQQFHPIEVRAKDGKPIRGRETLLYFILMYPPALDCVDINLTTWGDFGTGPDAYAKYSRLGRGPESTIALRQSVISGHHFWRGVGEFIRRNYFCSDELRSRLKEEKLKGWDIRKRCEIA